MAPVLILWIPRKRGNQFPWNSFQGEKLLNSAISWTIEEQDSKDSWGYATKWIKIHSNCPSNCLLRPGSYYTLPVSLVHEPRPNLTDTHGHSELSPSPERRHRELPQDNLPCWYLRKSNLSTLTSKLQNLHIRLPHGEAPTSPSHCYV